MISLHYNTHTHTHTSPDHAIWLLKTKLRQLSESWKTYSGIRHTHAWILSLCPVKATEMSHSATNWLCDRGQALNHREFCKMTIGLPMMIFRDPTMKLCNHLPASAPFLSPTAAGSDLMFISTWSELSSFLHPFQQSSSVFFQEV